MTFPLRCAIIFIRLVSFRVVCFEEKLHKSSSHQERFTGPSLNFLPKCGCTNYSAMPRSWTTLSFNVNTSHPSIPHAQRNKHHLHIKGAVTSVNQSKLLNSSAIKCTWSKKIWLCSVSFKRTIKKKIMLRWEARETMLCLCRRPSVGHSQPREAKSHGQLSDHRLNWFVLAVFGISSCSAEFCNFAIANTKPS